MISFVFLIVIVALLIKISSTSEQSQYHADSYEEIRKAYQKKVEESKRYRNLTEEK